MNAGGGYQPPGQGIVSQILQALLATHPQQFQQPASTGNPFVQAFRQAMQGPAVNPGGPNIPAVTHSPYDIGGETRTPDGGLWLGPPPIGPPDSAQRGLGGGALQYGPPQTVHIQYAPELYGDHGYSRPIHPILRYLGRH